MPYVSKKRPKTSDIGMTKHFPEYIEQAKEYSNVKKEIRRIADNPDNWRLDGLGRPYLVHPKTEQTISGVECPPCILYVLRKKRAGQTEPTSLVDFALGRWWPKANRPNKKHKT